MRPMSERFVSISSGRGSPYRPREGRTCAREIRGAVVERFEPEARVVDYAGCKNDTTSFPCVARRYSGSSGEIGDRYWGAVMVG